MLIIWGMTAAWAAEINITVREGVREDIAQLTGSLGAGDVITFEPGEYEIENTLVWEAPGEEANPIRIVPSGEGKVTFRKTGGGYGLEIRNSTWLIVEGITVVATDPGEEAGTSGIRVVDASDVRLTNCAVSDVWNTGLRVEGDVQRLTVEGMEIAFLGNGTGMSIGCGDASCFTVDAVFRNNLIHDVAQSAIFLQPGSQGVQLLDNVIFRAGARGVYLGPTELGAPNVAEGNAIWQTVGEGIYIEGAAQVRNNVLFEIGDDGIQTNNNDRDALADVVISHNTIANTAGFGANLEDWYDRGNMVFANNVIANPLGYGVRWDDRFEELQVPTSNYLSTNMVSGLVQGFAPLDFPDFVLPGGGYSDFVDAEFFDFYPRRGAPIVDAADPDGQAFIPTVDFNGTARQGDAPDIGAYEWNGDANPGWLIQEGFKGTGVAAGSDRFDVSAGGCCGKKDQSSEGWVFVPLLGLGALWRRRRARVG